MGGAVSAVSEWLALRRVHEGGVTRLGDRFFNHGRPVADYLATAFDDLIGCELLALGRATQNGQQPVCVTHSGQVRYAELNGTESGQAGRGG